MKNHRNRLADRRGVTIVFSLTVFLICTMLSMVIVVAAMNNAQRIRRQREQQQAMLAVTSAASYVRTLFDGVSAVHERSGSNSWAFQYGKSDLKDKGAMFEKIVKGAAIDATTGELDTAVQKWTITADASEIPKVLMELALKKNDLYVKLISSDGAGRFPGDTGYKKQGSYVVTLVFAGDGYPEIDRRIVDGQEREVEIVSYSWRYLRTDTVTAG